MASGDHRTPASVNTGLRICCQSSGTSPSGNAGDGLTTTTIDSFIQLRIASGCPLGHAGLNDDDCPNLITLATATFARSPTRLLKKPE
jgi:hypothetical protein